MIEIDIKSPISLCKQLEIFSDTIRLNEMVENNFEYYKLICNENTFKDNYENILNDYLYLLNRWK